jgi:preprotein translocase subunit SecY
MWIMAALCVLFSVVAAVGFRLSHPHGVLSYLVAVLPALPIMGALVYTGVYLAEEKDEFQRNLLVQSLLGGTGGILAVTTAWGYMEDFAHAPHMDLVWVYPLFWLCAGISYGIVKARYR